MQVTACTSTVKQSAGFHVQPVHLLGALAKLALIAEAELTPKPGLVDRRGSGAHHDLSLDLMRRSAETLEPYFSQMAFLSARRKLGTGLRAASSFPDSRPHRDRPGSAASGPSGRFSHSPRPLDQPAIIADRLAEGEISCPNSCNL